jgi:hypothetical protein
MMNYFGGEQVESDAPPEANEGRNQNRSRSRVVLFSIVLGTASDFRQFRVSIQRMLPHRFQSSRGELWTTCQDSYGVGLHYSSIALSRRCLYLQALAETWISKHNLIGTLTRYPLIKVCTSGRLSTAALSAVKSNTELESSLVVLPLQARSIITMAMVMSEALNSGDGLRFPWTIANSEAVPRSNRSRT